MESPAGDDVLANSITTMKTKSLKTYGGKLLLAGLAAAAISLGSAKAGAPDDLIALQLGAIQLGYTNIATNGNSTQQATALAQGRAVLTSTVKKLQVMTSNSTFPATTADIQSETLRAQIEEATMLALTTPANLDLSKVNVTYKDGKTKAVSAKVITAKTTASAVFAYTAKRLPNFGPGIITSVIDGALTQVNNVFIFNYKDATKAVADVNKAAQNAMTTSLKTYAAGTTNWAGVPKTGTVLGSVYLPNFSAKNIPGGTSVPVNSQQVPDLAGLANAAGAVAANAVAALNNKINGQIQTVTEANAVAGLATALVKGAASFQKTSTLTSPAGALNGGTVAASGFGLVTQYAGVAQQDWNASTNATILNAIVAGGVKASSANAYAFAAGVARGFAAAYFSTGGDATQQGLDALKLASAGDIETAFLNNKVKAQNKYTTLASVIDLAFTNTWTAFNSNNWNAIAGAGGISTDVVNGVIESLTFLNSAGSPVTDTVGL